MLLEHAAELVKRQLAKIVETEGGAFGADAWTHRLLLEDFPLPGLVQFVFTQLLGLTTYGPFEKMRWGVQFQYGAALYALEHRKFGLTLVGQPSAPPSHDLTQELLARLRRAVRIAERYLDGLAASQAQAGLVTVENVYFHLDGGYRFLRARAEATYAQPPPERIVHSRDALGNPMSWTSDPFKAEREGGYLAASMISAYFSRTEHLFVLCLPFCGFEPSQGRLLELIKSNWAAKYRAVLDVQGDREAKVMYDRLLAVRERIRNPLTHGGLKPDGSSLYFHLPGVGALPARMTRWEQAPHFSFSTVPLATFSEVCGIFDDFDTFLEQRPTSFGLRWSKSGLGVAFDPRSLREYRAAMAGDFGEYMRHKGHLHDRHVNMDY